MCDSVAAVAGEAGLAVEDVAAGCVAVETVGETVRVDAARVGALPETTGTVDDLGGRV